MKLGYQRFNKRLKKFRVKNNGKKYFVDGEWCASAISGLSNITEFPYKPYWLFNLYWFFTDEENSDRYLWLIGIVITIIIALID